MPFSLSLEQDVTDEQIELAINQTTGLGNSKANPYQIVSYLLNFHIIPGVIGQSAFLPVLRYLEKNRIEHTLTKPRTHDIIAEE